MSPTCRTFRNYACRSVKYCSRRIRDGSGSAADGPGCEWWFESQLYHALKLGELSLQYQPKVDLVTGKITSIEALIRWNNPKLGFVSPIEFIPVAEHTGLIYEIGAWVVHTACEQARRWKDAGFADVSVAENVSAIQFRREGLHEQIITMVAVSGLEPRVLGEFLLYAAIGV